MRRTAGAKFLADEQMGLQLAYVIVDEWQAVVAGWFPDRAQLRPGKPQRNQTWRLTELMTDAAFERWQSACAHCGLVPPANP